MHFSFKCALCTLSLSQALCSMQREGISCERDNCAGPSGFNPGRDELKATSSEKTLGSYEMKCRASHKGTVKESCNGKRVKTVNYNCTKLNLIRQFIENTLSVQSILTLQTFKLFELYTYKELKFSEGKTNCKRTDTH